MKKEKTEPQCVKIKIEGKLLTTIILLKEKLSQLGIDIVDKSLIVKGDEITIK